MFLTFFVNVQLIATIALNIFNKVMNLKKLLELISITQTKIIVK